MSMPPGFPTHPTWMELNTQALIHNLAEIRRRVGGGVQVIASVKANAYGHGIVEVARTLENAGVEMLATGSFTEAKTMRAAGLTTPILMLAGSLPEGLSELIDAGMVPTVYDEAGARAVDAAAGSGVAAPVFVKVDVGLGRLGVGVTRAVDFVDGLSLLPGVRVEGIYTHLAFRDDAGMAYTRDRIGHFYSLLDALKARGHEIPTSQALASSALLAGWADKCTAVCPGHLLYGISPMSEGTPINAGFRPVLRTINSRVIHVADHVDGPPPGSGGYHVRRATRRTAVAPCGANEGNRSAVSGKTAEVLYQGRRLRILGCSLEHLTFEILDDLEIEVGDTVSVLGGDGPGRITLEEFADWWDTSPLDVMLSFSGRMPVAVSPV